MWPIMFQSHFLLSFLFYLMFSMSTSSMDHFPLRLLKIYSFSINQEQSLSLYFLRQLCLFHIFIQSGMD